MNSKQIIQYNNNSNEQLKWIKHGGSSINNKIIEYKVRNPGSWTPVSTMDHHTKIAINFKPKVVM